MVKKYTQMLKNEFQGYNGKRFGQDLLAGLTVAAVALPLALAFGVSSGADAAAGLITAIVAGFLMSMLSGASYQISGPTGAMTAILIALVSKYKMQGVFLACGMAGIFLLVAAFLKLGRIVSFIPAPVITGFTSGIAIIIALGQIDNFFGCSSSGENTVQKLGSYFTNGFSVNLSALLIGIMTILIMILWPKKLGARFPSSLAAIIIAVIINAIFKLPLDVVGKIPQTLFPETRLDLSAVRLNDMQALITPAISIAALGMIESLLCGASASRMKGERIDSNLELFAQGIGNLILPFFGGLPATAAIARTSVAIKSGGQTRLTGIIHAAGLLISMFLLTPVMSIIPLSALAGVLIVTAWRMNEWHAIRYIFSKKFVSGILEFLVTMVATVIFDLTVAIVIGMVFALIGFVIKVSNLDISVSDVNAAKLEEQNLTLKPGNENAKVVYITGPIFFSNVEQLHKQVKLLTTADTIVFSMRGVSFVDTSGVQALIDIFHMLKKNEINIILSSIQPKVMTIFEQAEIVSLVGKENFFWSVADALADTPAAVA